MALQNESTATDVNSPAFLHRQSRPSAAMAPGAITWLTAEPYRLFFLSGILWSIAGVSLWPLFYAGELTFYPGLTHARLMIEAFGGAFVAGFLGTAGPRMAGAPRLTSFELLALFALHTVSGVFHLKLMIKEGDTCFLAFLVLLLACLAVRMIFCRRDTPPPQMLLVLTGLLCGIAGTFMWLSPDRIATPGSYRLAGLLLYQGLLLPPVLGIGSFIFPRILGGGFGDPGTARAAKATLWRTVIAAVLLVVSFPIESFGSPVAGGLLRAGAAVAYLLAEIRWRRAPGSAPRGSLATGLHWSLGTGLAGLAVAGYYDERRVALEHLLFIGGFGLIMLIVASRVLFGHSGELAAFARKSWTARLIVFFAVLAATTRASADFWPAILISHHKYAAWSWAVAAGIWLVWHRRRFLKRGEE
jgi:uncharacterized protein involved in response to NO